jgi:hypothetical protein
MGWREVGGIADFLIEIRILEGMRVYHRAGSALFLILWNIEAGTMRKAGTMEKAGTLRKPGTMR